MKLVRRVLIGLGWLALLAGCTSGGDGEGALTVFAAASLTDAFERIGGDARFNFGPSNGLAIQILEGAPADVFASASEAQMQVVAEEGLLAEDPLVFATNVLEIAVEPGNPLGIAGLTDLADADVVVVLAAPEVPAGQYAAEALAAAGVTLNPASIEEDVRGVLSRVALGEADAGIVYRSDVVAAEGDVEGVAIPAEHNVIANYPVAVLASAPNPRAAAEFVYRLQSDEAQAVLSQLGFSSP